MYAIMSPLLQDTISAKATGMTATGIKAAKVKLIPVPVPSVEEQKRIVAKVDQLIALCDHLETSIRDKSEIAERYANAIVKQMAAA
jgi:type I restriction enzyme, S subunit